MKINTTQCLIVKASKALIVEASDLHLGMPPVEIDVQSARTGKVARFRFLKADKDSENEVQGWNYVPAWLSPDTMGLAGWHLLIVND